MTANHAMGAIVTGAFGRRMALRLEDGRELSGRVKGRRLQPVCGDFGDRRAYQAGTGLADYRYRPAPQRAGEAGQSGTQRRFLRPTSSCVAVVAAQEPRPDWFIVDRYLAAAENMDATGIVLFNKSGSAGDRRT